MTMTSVKTAKNVIRILVVDDDDDMCWALERFIKLEGHQPTVVSNARAAMSILEAQDFDLLFADVKLPDMDGFELVRNIRPDHPRLPCVLVSGFYYNNDDAVQNALSRPSRHRLSLEAVSLRPVQEDYRACFDFLNHMEKNSPHAPIDRNATADLAGPFDHASGVGSREFTPDSGIASHVSRHRARNRTNLIEQKIALWRRVWRGRYGGLRSLREIWFVHEHACAVHLTEFAGPARCEKQPSSCAFPGIPRTYRSCLNKDQHSCPSENDERERPFRARHVDRAVRKRSILAVQSN